MLGPRIYCGEIENRLLTLTPTQEYHLPVCVRWLNDPEVSRYLCLTAGMNHALEREWYEGVVRDHRRVVWSIELGGEHIGQTGIEQIDWVTRTGHTGIFIGDKRWWGKGVATQVMRRRAEYAFTQLNLVALFTESFLPNEASRKAALRTGYREYGRRPFARFQKGVYLEMWLGVLSREDWERAEVERTA